MSCVAAPLNLHLTCAQTIDSCWRFNHCSVSLHLGCTSIALPRGACLQFGSSELANTSMIPRKAAVTQPVTCEGNMLRRTYPRPSSVPIAQLCTISAHTTLWLSSWRTQALRSRATLHFVSLARDCEVTTLAHVHPTLGPMHTDARKPRRDLSCAASSPDVADVSSTSDSATSPGRRPASQPPPPPPPSSGAGPIRKAVRYAEKKLSNLGLAMVELAILAALSAVGTIIEQDQVRSDVA